MGHLSPLSPHQPCLRKWNGTMLVAEIHLTLTSLSGEGAPCMSIIIPGEPQLSPYSDLRLQGYEPCTVGSLPSLAHQGRAGRLGAPWKMSRVSLKLIGGLVRVSWSGSGVWQSTEEIESLLTPCGFHYPAGLFAPEWCRRPSNRIH